MLHISLNFDRAEQLSKELLVRITERYMEGIGFDKQPHLVYQHTDAGHPHLHIITSAIQADGRRIPLHNLVQTKSEPTRKAIEEEFGLVKAAGRQEEQGLQQIATSYKYASLEEYNALLRTHNLSADPVAADRERGHHGGLVYRRLDELGNPSSPPIKASAFHFKPTLRWLDKQFEGNKQSREGELESIRHRIDWAQLQHPDSIRDFVDGVRKERIELVVHQDRPVWIDHQSKTVIAGEALGPAYAADIFQSYKQGRQQESSQELTPDRLQQASQLFPLPPAFNTKTPQPLNWIIERDPSWGRRPDGRDLDRSLDLEPSM
jgi:hypothetical protein